MYENKQQKFKITGMDCPSCGQTIEIFCKNIGIENARVNFSSSELILQNCSTEQLENLTNKIKSIGYEITAKIENQQNQTVEAALQTNAVTHNLLLLTKTQAVFYSKQHFLYVHTLKRIGLF